MAISFVLNHNTGSATSATPTFTLAGDVSAGNVLVVFAGFDNSGLNLPSVSSIDVPGGETAAWSLLTGARVTANATATAGAGVIGEMWAIKTTQLWPSGTTVTVTLGASVKVALLCQEFSGALKTLRGTSGTGTSTAGAPSAATSGTALVTGDLVVGGAVVENSGTYTTDIDTTNGSWSTILNAHVGGGASAAQVEACIQHKIVTAAGIQTYNPAGIAAGDAGAVVVSLIPDPNVTVPAGTTTGTGVAQDPAADIGVNAETTTAAGAAYDATVSTGGVITKTHNYEGGTNGSTIQTTDTGSGDAWDTATGTRTYTSTSPLAGTLSGSYALAASTDSDTRWTTSVGQLNAFKTRGYFSIDANPTAIARIWQTFNASNTAIWGVAVDTTGHVGIRNLGTGAFATNGLSTATLAANTRHSYDLDASWDGTDWTVSLSLFLGANADGATADETLTTTGGLTLGSVTQYAWGALSTSGITWTVKHDGVILTTNTLPARGASAPAELASGTGTAYDATVTTGGGGGGAVTLRGYGGFGNLAAAGGTLNVPYRTDIAVGDAMVISVSTNGSTVTTPTGWTLIKALTTPTNPKVYGFLKIADSTDVANASGGGNVAITVASSTASGRMGAYSSVDGTTPQDVAATEIQNAATTTTIVIPAPAAGTAGRMEIAGYGANSASSTYTPGSPFTERADFFVDNGNVTVGKGGGMADYSDTAGSGSGVTVTIDAGARANAGWIIALKPAAGGAPSTNAPAELASGTGTSHDALTAVGGNADTTTSVGTATDAVASVAANADTTTGAGTAFDATVSTVTQTNAPAELAAGVGVANDATPALGASAGATAAAGTGFDATVSTAAQANAPAGLASGTGAANDPSTAVTVQAEIASGTGIGFDALGSIGTNADTTAAAGTAAQPTAAPAANADTATAAGTGYDATVSTSAQANAPAELASAAGAAFDATVPLSVAAGTTAATGTAFDATASTAAQTNAPAELASATAVAYDTAITITVPAGTTTAAGAAYDATVQALYAANAGHAAGTGSAFDATVAIGAAANPATAAGTAFDATMSTKWVYRPNTGTTSRPGSGTTGRPFAGTTVRP